MWALAELDPDQSTLTQFLDDAGFGHKFSRSYAIALVRNGKTTVVMLKNLSEERLATLMDNIGMRDEDHRAIFKDALA